MESIKKIIKKVLLVDEGPKPLFLRKAIDPIKRVNKNGFIYCEFGNLNPEKTFYVINRTSHAGIFSYLSFVLNHLLVAKENNFIPIVDMENFANPYNEEGIINNTFNSWEYYFHQTSNHFLEEVYKSKNVIFSKDHFSAEMKYRIHLEPKFKNFISKEIKLKKKYIDFVDEYYEKNKLNNLNILGIHFRGTSYKTSRGHIFPATTNQMKYYVDKLLSENKFDKIFLCTEEKNYLNFFKENYLNKLLYIDSHRSDKNDAFKIYNRSNHRFLLGDESIKETLILSKCSSLLFVRSNIINAQIFSLIKSSIYLKFLIDLIQEINSLQGFFGILRKIFQKNFTG